jgi:hypothetical protein
MRADEAGTVGNIESIKIHPYYKIGVGTELFGVIVRDGEADCGRLN